MINSKGGWVYILTNMYNRVLYTGVTSQLVKRIKQHKSKKYPFSFTARYRVHKLVYFVAFPFIVEAIEHEKFIKGKSRAFKLALIEEANPFWEDLFPLIEDEFDY
ncbi:MAG: putative endonuclease [Bacteroidia bacterium]|jgi:putative endonuclease